MKRTKIHQRQLPDYTKGEEIFNMVSHIVGGGIGVVALILCVLLSAFHRDPFAITGSAIYGCSLIALYTVSSVYHGLKPSTAKKVMQVIDHCTIYFLISGSYTPFALSAIRPAYPVLGWGIFIFEWALTALAITLTAIDLKRYSTFSMVCYVGMGWAIFPFMKQVIEVMTISGFVLLLSGGISYTIGAILYGLGKKKRWMHSVFHILVVIGSVLQFLSIFLYVL